MNKVFCVSCGFKNPYEITKPKFCASCGTPVAGVPAKVSQAKAPVVVEEESEEYEESIMGNIDIRRLRRDIVAESNSSKITLTDLWKSASPEDARSIGNFSRPAANLPQGEEILKRNRADCASSRVIEVDG
jgi:hypothetical protein